MAVLQGTVRWYNGGWASNAIGGNPSYVSYDTSTSYRTIIDFTITPSPGHKVTGFSVTLGLGGNYTSGVSVTGYLYNSVGNKVSGPPSGYIASSTSSSFTMTSSGSNFTLSYSGFDFTESRSFSIWLCTHGTGFATIYTGAAANMSRASYSVSQIVNEFYFDLNGVLDGSWVGNINGYGTCDIYMNGSRVANDVTDYYAAWPKGTTYSIQDISPSTGKQYNGVSSGSLSGTINGTTSVYLNFSTKVYTVSYDINGGSSQNPSSQTFSHGSSVRLAGTPSKNRSSYGVRTTFNANNGSVSPSYQDTTAYVNYQFNHWNSSADGRAYSAGANYSTQASTTMTAQWSESYSGSSVSLPTPSRTGYGFIGWYTAASGGNRVTSYSPTSNSTLYAHWSPNTYTVSYDSNGGNSVGSQSFTYGNSVTIASNPGRNSVHSSNATVSFDAQGGQAVASRQNKVYTNYTFNNWHSGSSVYRGGESYSSASNLYLTAWWTSYQTADTISSLPSTQRKGYTFLGWFTASSGGTQVTSLSPASNVTLYAHWRPNTYTVTYKGNGGIWNGQTSWSNTATFDSNYYIEPNFFSRPGYKFIGWNTNPEGTGEAWTADSNWTWTYDRDIVLYAIWKVQGLIRIHDGKRWRSAQVFVRSGNKWHQSIPKQFSGGKWHTGG